MTEYESFFEMIGFTVVRPEKYSPVFHEIVSVEQSINDECPIKLIDVYWPTTILGNMLFSRGGAAVEAGSHFVDKERAEKSPMLWAYRRANRECDDLSVGWGSNSQWRTEFRRDYIFGSIAHLNVDADDSRASESNLPPNPELVLNRCAIKSDLGDYSPHAWPFDTRMLVDVEPLPPR